MGPESVDAFGDETMAERSVQFVQRMLENHGCGKRILRRCSASYCFARFFLEIDHRLHRQNSSMGSDSSQAAPRAEPTLVCGLRHGFYAGAYSKDAADAEGGRKEVANRYPFEKRVDDDRQADPVEERNELDPVTARQAEHKLPRPTPEFFPDPNPLRIFENVKRHARMADWPCRLETYDESTPVASDGSTGLSHPLACASVASLIPSPSVSKVEVARSRPSPV